MDIRRTTATRPAHFTMLPKRHELKPLEERDTVTFRSSTPQNPAMDIETAAQKGDLETIQRAIQQVHQRRDQVAAWRNQHSSKPTDLPGQKEYRAITNDFNEALSDLVLKGAHVAARAGQRGVVEAIRNSLNYENVPGFLGEGPLVDLEVDQQFLYYEALVGAVQGNHRDLINHLVFRIPPRMKEEVLQDALFHSAGNPKAVQNLSFYMSDPDKVKEMIRAGLKMEQNYQTDCVKRNRQRQKAQLP